MKGDLHFSVRLLIQNKLEQNHLALMTFNKLRHNLPCLSDPDPDLAGDLPRELGVRGAPEHAEVEPVPPGAVERRLKWISSS